MDLKWQYNLRGASGPVLEFIHGGNKICRVSTEMVGLIPFLKFRARLGSFRMRRANLYSYMVISFTSSIRGFIHVLLMNGASLAMHSFILAGAFFFLALALVSQD